jgi:hypothetical protein
MLARPLYPNNGFCQLTSQGSNSPWKQGTKAKIIKAKSPKRNKKHTSFMRLLFDNLVCQEFKVFAVGWNGKPYLPHSQMISGSTPETAKISSIFKIINFMFLKNTIFFYTLYLITY